MKSGETSKMHKGEHINIKCNICILDLWTIYATQELKKNVCNCHNAALLLHKNLGFTQSM